MIKVIFFILPSYIDYTGEIGRQFQMKSAIVSGGNKAG
jgi:hypothetical protein